jgi:hypothetical protein
MEEQSPEDTGKLVKGDSDYIVGASPDDDDDIYSDERQEKTPLPKSSQARKRRLRKRVVSEPVGGESDGELPKSKKLLDLEKKYAVAKTIEASFAHCVRKGVDDNGEHFTVGNAQSAAYHQLRDQVPDLNVKDWIGNGKQTLKTLFDRHGVDGVTWPPGKGDVDVDGLQRAVQDIFAARIREVDTDTDMVAQLRATMWIHTLVIQIAKHSFDLSKKKKSAGKKKVVSAGVRRQREVISVAVEKSKLGPINTAFTRSKGEAEIARKEKQIAAAVAPPSKKSKHAQEQQGEEEEEEEERIESERLEEDEELDLDFEPMNIPTTDDKDKGEAEPKKKTKNGGDGGAGRGTKGRRRLSDAKEENRMLEYVREKQKAELEKEAAETARRAAQLEHEARERKLDRELRLEELSLERERLRLKAESDRQELELRKQREQQELEFKKQQLQMQMDLQNKLLEALTKK